MKISYNFLLTKEEYTPEVGTEYEVAPDVWCAMKYPTIKLQESVFKKAENDDTEDFEVMKMVLGGADTLEKDDCIFGMPTRVVQDFFTLLSLIVERLSASSESSDPSANPEEQKTQS